MVLEPGVEPHINTLATDLSSDKNNARSQVDPKPAVCDETNLGNKNSFPLQRGSWQKGEWDTPNKNKKITLESVSHNSNIYE